MRDFKLRDYTLKDVLSDCRVILALTEDERQYLEEYLWEAIEENWTYKDNTYTYAPSDFMDSLYQDIYQGDCCDRMSLDFDIDDQLCDVLVVLQNPKTKHFWGFFGWESKYEESYDYQPIRVEPAEKVVSTWKMGEKVF